MLKNLEKLFDTVENVVCCFSETVSKKLPIFQDMMTTKIS